MDYFKFEYAGRKKVKGKSVPLEVYKPFFSSVMDTRGQPHSAKEPAEIFGRQKEKAQIHECVKGLKGGKSHVLIVEGDRGQGITTMSDYTKQQCLEWDVFFRYGSNDKAVLELQMKWKWMLTFSCFEN